MHKMRAIAMDDPGRLSVCHARLRCADTTRRIDVLLGGVDSWGRWDRVTARRDSTRPSPNYFERLLAHELAGLQVHILGCEVRSRVCITTS